MTQALGRLRLELIDKFCGVHVPLFDKVGTSVLIVTSLFIRCVPARELSGYASHGSLHSGQTPDRRMAEASSEKRLSCCKYKSLFSTENFRIFMMRKFRLSVLGKLYKSWERIFLVAIRATELFCSGQGAMAEAPNLEGILAPLLLRVARLEAHVTTMDLPFVEDRLDNMETVVAALGREFDALAQRLEELQRQIRRLEAAVCSLERERRSINDLADRISNLEIASGQETQRALGYHQIVLQELDHRVASLESPAHPDNP